MATSPGEIGYLKPALGILTGPIVWFVDQQVSYIVLQWACAGGRHPGLFFYIIALVALAILGFAGVLSWRIWRNTSGKPSSETSPRVSALHFLGGMGLLINALFFLAIIAMAIPRIVLGPCQT